MKLFAMLCIFLLAAVDLSMQLPQKINCTEGFPQSLTDCECCKVTCSSNEDMPRIHVVDCSISFCPAGKLLRYDGGDNTLMFPECCKVPVCAS